MMNQQALNLKYSQNNPSPISKVVFFIGIFWFTLVLVAALSGTFTYSIDQRPISILIAIATPVIIYSIAYSFIPVFRDWVLSIDIRRLILLHSWRMVGIGFVFLYFQDQLPALFALPAGIGDAMAAAGAVFLAITLYENSSKVTYRRIWRWNTFGLVDFIVAVSMGVLTRTGDIFHIEGQAGSDIMSIFPQAMIPGFFVPFYIITHLMIYAQLRTRAETPKNSVEKF